MTTSAMLLAAWFVNPALLVGLGLTALPVLIHLLSRRQFRRIAWGATRFLLEAERENRRRVRFEQWLLVALRCLAIALLALLLARPYVQPGLVASLLGGRGPVPRVILIDDSASLSFRTGTTSDFAQLREAALRLLAWLHEGAAGDPVTIYLTSQPAEPLVASQRLTAASLTDLQADVRGLEPVNWPAHPYRVLETIAGSLSAEGVPADLYVLSDFQRSEWLTLDSAGAAVFERLSQLDVGAVRVILIATWTTVRDNVAVLDVRPERPQTVAGMPAVLNATVANYAREPLDGAHVEVAVGGAPLPPVPLETIAPGESRRVSVEVTFPDEGFSEVAVGVDAVDGLAADNSRRLALPVVHALTVLLVNGQPATDPVRDEVYFLSNALAPAGPFSSGIRVQSIDPDDIEATALDAFDCVMLCNVAAPGEGAVAALQRYVEKGGGLLFFLGDQVGDPDEYNRVFYGAGEGLLPLPLRELCRRDSAAEGVGLVRTSDHPTTAMFPAEPGSLSRCARFHTYYRCAESLTGKMSVKGEPREPVATVVPAVAEQPVDAEPQVAARPPPAVLVRFTDDAQTPALVERVFGRGRVLLFASSVDLDWNDWARAMDGSYVVTMLELVACAARHSEERRSFVAGEKLALSLLPDEYEPGGCFRMPGSAGELAAEGRVREPSAAVGEPIVLEGPLATRLGTYTAELVRRGGDVELRPLPVNLDAAESDLTVARAPELDAALGSLPHEYVRAADAFLPAAQAARRELWPAILLALVAVLMVEQTLACWFGRPERGSQTRRRSFSLLGRLSVGTK